MAVPVPSAPKGFHWFDADPGGEEQDASGRNPSNLNQLSSLKSQILQGDQRKIPICSLRRMKIRLMLDLL